MKNLIVSLIKFQQTVKPIPKNKRNPFFNSMYAELSTVIEVCQPTMNANGLAIMQRMLTADGKNVLVTTLAHESGEMMSSEMYLPDLADAQKLTAAVTYLRRSQYLAILGLVADDDCDGNSTQETPRHDNNQGRVEQTKLAGGVAASDAQKNLMSKLGIKFDPNITKQEAMNKIKEHNDRGAR